MKLLISAAETSSDIHGAHLLQALRGQFAQTDSGELEVWGIGGPKLQAAGLRPVVDARGLLSMGFLEILGRLPRIFGALRRVAREAAKDRPDLAIVIDYPDFHFRLAKRLKKLGVPVVYYIPPKVWAWRQGRVRILKERFVKILSILPFEEEFFREHQVSAKYVGNPLVDELPLNLTREEARKKLGIEPDALVLLVMPGSRPAELKHHLEPMLEAALLAARRVGRLVVQIPFPETTELALVQGRIEAWGRENSIDVRVSRGDAAIAMVAADAGLIKSGTSTLEAGILQCPHVIAYRSNGLTHFIFEKFVRKNYAGPVGLVNLVYGWKKGEPLLIRELLAEAMTPSALAEEAIELLVGARKQEVLAGLAQVRSKILGDTARLQLGPSDLAAREILRLARELHATRRTAQ